MSNIQELVSEFTKRPRGKVIEVPSTIKTRQRVASTIKVADKVLGLKSEEKDLGVPGYVDESGDSLQVYARTATRGIIDRVVVTRASFVLQSGSTTVEGLVVVTSNNVDFPPRARITQESESQMITPSEAALDSLARVVADINVSEGEGFHPIVIKPFGVESVNA